MGKNLADLADTGLEVLDLYSDPNFRNRLITRPTHDTESPTHSAMAGLRPVPEIQFADFITPAMDALTQQAAKLRYRSGGSQTCPITLRVCYGGGTGGASGLPMAGSIS